MSRLNNFDEYKVIAEEAADLYNKGDNPKALEKFKILEKHNPENFKIHETLSYIYLNLNDVPNAEREYKIALDLAGKQNENFARPLTFEALVKSVGDPVVVEKEFIRVMKEAPSEEVNLNQHTRTAIQLGVLYMAKGDYKKAEQLLTAFKKKYEVALA
jgi:Tfp pilus assembly protein PilF